MADWIAWLQRFKPRKAAAKSMAVSTRRNRGAQWQRLGLIGIVFGAISVTAVVFMGPTPKTGAKPTLAPVPKTRDIGTSVGDVDKDAWRSLSAAEIEAMRRDLAELRKNVSDGQAEQTKARAAASAAAAQGVVSPPPVRMTGEGSPFTQAGAVPPSPGGPTVPSGPGAAPPSTYEARIDRIRVMPDGGAGRMGAEAVQGRNSGDGSYAHLESNANEGVRGRRPVRVGERFEPEDPLLPNRAGGRGVKTYIPAGTNMRVMLVQGMDAPTSGQGQTNPHPALFSVIDAANLPNGFSGDLEGCVITGNGYGDISSERAYIRTDRLSCIDASGGAIDVKLTGYAAGEDGKAGVRGKIVSKTGAMLANAMWAGLGAGFSQALKSAATTTTTTPLGGVTSTIDGNQIMRAGAASGVSRAMDMLARYYIKLAENTFPVVEINAERVIDIVVTKGFTIERQ